MNRYILDLRGWSENRPSCFDGVDEIPAVDGQYYCKYDLDHANIDSELNEKLKSYSESQMVNYLLRGLREDDDLKKLREQRPLGFNDYLPKGVILRKLEE